jgi:hypothetical protein
MVSFLEDPQKFSDLRNPQMLEAMIDLSQNVPVFWGQSPQKTEGYPELRLFRI